ncbi:DMT family transporter [Pseudomonas chlororaphis]|nr:DMT family transporter [Pseudomonas chlororaphis]
MTSRTSLAAGVALAIFATLSWSLNFIAPYVTGAYSIHDLMALRFLLAGAIGAVLLVIHRAGLRFIRPGWKLVSLGLGIAGYLGYSTSIAIGVVFGGPLLTPSLIAMVPILLALLGNAHYQTLAWKRLAVPLVLLGAGLGLIHLSAATQAMASPRSLTIGLAASIVAVLLWLLFSLLNQKALHVIPAASVGAWTGLMMSGGALGTLCLVPIGLMLGVFRLPALGFGLEHAGWLYAWALAIALFSSVAGAWAWNQATQRLPMVLSGQLVSLESLFATLLGLAFHGRWPTPVEALGFAAILLGVLLAVREILSAETACGEAFSRA